MNQNKSLWLLTLLLLAAVGGGALATGFSMIRSAQAQQAETVRKEKWEYCAITYADWNADSFNRSIGFAFIHYFDASGSREEKLEVKLEKSSADQTFNGKREVTARAMAKLGNDGWEMVERESSYKEYSENFIYFKRLKP